MKDLSLIALQESTKGVVPFKADEIADAVRQSNAGNTAVRDRLLLSNIGLVVKLATPYLQSGALLGLEASDLVMAGLYGLPGGKRRTGMIRAIEKFDPSRGWKLITYARYWILDAIQQTLFKASDWRTRQLPEQESSGESSAELKAELRIGLGKLNAQQRFVIAMIHLEGAKHSEVAEAMSTTIGKIKELEIDGLAALRGHLEP